MTRLGRIASRSGPQAHGGLAPRAGSLEEIARFGSNPGQLRMKVRAPRTRGPRAPLVVVLHGCTQSAEDYAGPAGWLDLADRFGFVVVAPEQARSNNPNLCFNWFEPGDSQRQGGEAASIAQMVSHAIRTFDLDRARVFVTGLSAGGAMTSVMLATHPEMFAGGAIVAGLPYGVAGSVGEALEAMTTASPLSAERLGDLVRGATDHPGPWPTVTVWHGQVDRVVRPSAGEAAAAQWRDVHQAAGPALTARTPDGRDFVVWRSSKGDPAVELHRVPGLGHGAPVRAHGPNGCGQASRHTPETGLSSTFEIALGWGLVERDVLNHAAEPAGDPAPEPLTPLSWRGADPSTVGATINDALRAAGLLR
ncbi:alpha/beta hydrolase family esterase [Brevundimonas lutea]|uniref:extracellular catalytic domain type 1 short-chain-length polyhydroxyalkanoate depolymerase n=1 Tax=Brevundimonas lutea TaxID=2293980 RepID=UPI0013CEEDB9|nr:PHB depolymerase family esterase [Brevundimonas lutea]